MRRTRFARAGCASLAMPCNHVGGMAHAIMALDLDPGAVFVEADLPVSVRMEPELVLCPNDLGRVMNVLETATGCDHVGLVVAQSGIPVGAEFLLLYAPDLGTGLRAFLSALNAGPGALVSRLDLIEGFVTLRFAVAGSCPPGAPHLLDCAVAYIYALLSRYCDDAFTVDQISFSRRPPADIGPYRKQFGRTKLCFDSGETQIEFHESLMSHVSRGSDIELFNFLSREIRWNSSTEADLVSAATKRLKFMLSEEGGKPSMLAAEFSLSQRTLNRRLSARGVSFRNLVAQARLDNARYLLLHTDMPISRLAFAAGYADATALSRAFKAIEGVTPLTYRRSRTTTQLGQSWSAVRFSMSSMMSVAAE